ncbi:mitochondrial RNA polymerase isoform X2 [Calliopsis andreniformis]|uniref:mitochondrial RNA polymerase isoform X2 n=1 Tax=Calliopsis andreniformis TaxID=337506 RepID=UPI003FCEDE2B
MYKLFVTRVTKRIPSPTVSFTSKQLVEHCSMRLCSFCNFYHWKTPKLVTHFQIRTSTTTALDHSIVKKKKKKRTRKYAELLEVTDEKTSNKRATLKKLNAANVSMFVSESDVANISNIENSFEHKVSDLKDLEHININDHQLCQNFCDSDFESSMDVLPDSEVEHNNELDTHKETFADDDDIAQHDEIHLNKNTAKNKKLGKQKKSKRKGKSQKEKETSHSVNFSKQMYIQKLLAYMQVYLHCGKLTEAEAVLLKHRNYVQNNVTNGYNYIELYNLLLEAYVSRRHLDEVLQLYTMMKEDSVTPTPQTYAYVLNALAKATNTCENRIDYLNKLANDMKQYHVLFNDIFNKSYFKNDQQDNVLKMVRLLQPEFKPVYTKRKTKNTCAILDKTLAQNNYESPVKDLLTINDLKNLTDTQIQNELLFEVEIENISNQKDIKAIHKSKQTIAEIENKWRNVATAAFKQNLNFLKKKEMCSETLEVLHPFLEVLDIKCYIDAIIREVKSLALSSETYSPSLRTLHTILGKHVFRKYELKIRQETGELSRGLSIYKKYLEWYLNPESVAEFTSNMNNRHIWQHLEWEQKVRGISLNAHCISWPQYVIVNIGKFLYNIILNDILLPSENLKKHGLKYSVPAFYTLFRNKGCYLIEQVKPHPIVSKLYKELLSGTISFETILIPSCSPPCPWTSIYTGGYVLTNTDFMRLPNHSNMSWQKLKDTPTEELSPVFDSLNQLSSIPWTVNVPILDIVIEIFQNGGSEELHVPQSISILPPPPPINKDATPAEKQKAAVAMTKYRRKKYDMHSIWCDTLYRLSLANHAKPLGAQGLDWLKLHVINLTNLKKKASIEERLAYANENLENMLDSAAKPLTGKMWWMKSEEPWQTLAGCMEIANALKAPNVEEYESRFPIHQDGSCNGLQHYAALGRDQIGAESVNLYPSDVPQDVYAAVANIIEKERQIDAKNNIEIAKILDGVIKRKVIKQTVMTTVYGVTKYGAKLQIMKQLHVLPEFPQKYVWQAGGYLADKTFHTLRSMFESARQIQDWLTTCARIISKNCNSNVEWITPLGLPIVQPYLKGKTSNSNKEDTQLKPDGLKQKNAFAPNFIHSLDSTHMMLTSLYCREAGITFVSVHDCFWTHACSVDIMNQICREQFIALHSEPILETLSAFFLMRYIPYYTALRPEDSKTIKNMHKCFISVPQKGTFDINNVLKSKYFFS